ncbi:MAG: hypothetical protein LAO06_04010 [Acidobacteriia bacterium]|nr:hypothetical protein [Terriglobia bacterium]
MRLAGPTSCGNGIGLAGCRAPVQGVPYFFDLAIDPLGSFGPNNPANIAGSRP